MQAEPWKKQTVQKMCRISGNHSSLYQITLNVTGTSPVVYTRLSAGRYRITIQAACPGQRFKDGPRERVRFTVQA